MPDTTPCQPPESGAAAVTVEVADQDRLTILVDRIRVMRRDGALAAPCAPQVAEAVTYLSEPLRVVESEPDEVLIRSARPATHQGRRQFFDMRFHGSEAVLERRQTQDGDGGSVPFGLSPETLDRLVDDLGRLMA